MHETNEDRAALQRILDESYGAAGVQLRSVFSRERCLSAEDLTQLLTGVLLLNVAVVTESGAPLVAPVDGVFFRGRVWFGFPPGSVRGRILRKRPQVSATHTQEGTVCIIVHGVAHEIRESHAAYSAYNDYLSEVYGSTLELSRAMYNDRDGTEYSGWIEPRRFFATRPHPTV